MESFYATLKGELVEQRDYLTRDEARADVFQFLEGWYNRRRLHSALGYLTPEQKLAAFHAAASAAQHCPRKRLFRKKRGSGREEHTTPEEVELGTPEGLPLQ